MGDFTNLTDLLLVYQRDDLVRLTRNDGSSLLSVDEDVLNWAIGQAEAYVKSFIQSKYDLPFTEVPVVVKQCARFMTYYNLVERKNRVTNQMELQYNNIRNILLGLQSGKQVLDTLPLVNDFQTQDTQGSIEIETSDRDITESNLELM